MPRLRQRKVRSSRLRVACFGAGWVTTHRHLPALRAHGGFEVVAIADPVEERARAAARRFGVRQAFAAEGVEELPAAVAAELDAVVVGSSPDTHFEVTRGALRAGKHVLSEKPLAVGAENAEELADAAAERGLVCAVGHNFLFARSMANVRSWLAAGRLGALRSIRAMQLTSPARRMPAGVERLPLGLFYDESPNLFYLSRALAGAELAPLDAVVHPARSEPGPTPARVDVHLESAAGVPVGVHMDFESPVSEWHVALLGERGVAVVDVFRDIALFIPSDGEHGARQVLRTSVAATAGHWRGHLRAGAGHLLGNLRYGADGVLSSFYAAIAEGRRLDGISARDAVAVARLQEFVVDRARVPTEAA